MSSENARTHMFLHEAMRIIDEASNRGIMLRTMGAIAIMQHCPKFAVLYKSFARELSDLDFFGYKKQNTKINMLVKDMGYTRKPLMYSFARSGRSIFINNASGHVVDVFLDKLMMCHTIDLKGRLELDYPTIPLANLLLQKMQIVKLGEKDVKDTIVLLREHEVGDTDEETINASYIAKLLSRDWGFYYTVTTNLAKIERLLPKYENLNEQDKADIIPKIGKIATVIQKEPKSLGWKARAKIGTKKKWYREVSTPSK